MNNLTTFDTICSYTGTLTYTVTSFRRTRTDNTFSLTMKVFPPLNVFKISSDDQISAVFRVDTPSIKLLSMRYNPQSEELELKCEIIGDMVDNTMTVAFVPSATVRAEYTYSVVGSPVVITIDKDTVSLQFISASQLAIADILLYAGYGFSVLGWITCVLGLLMRRLSGI